MIWSGWTPPPTGPFGYDRMAENFPRPLLLAEKQMTSVFWVPQDSPPPPPSDPS